MPQICGHWKRRPLPAASTASTLPTPPRRPALPLIDAADCVPPLFAVLLSPPSALPFTLRLWFNWHRTTYPFPLRPPTPRHLAQHPRTLFPTDALHPRGGLFTGVRRRGVRRRGGRAGKARIHGTVLPPPGTWDWLCSKTNRSSVFLLDCVHFRHALERLNGVLLTQRNPWMCLIGIGTAI